MSGLEFWGGAAVLLVFLAIICVGYIAHMAGIMQDIAEEKAESIADRRFEEMLDTAEVKVTQRLVIVDEMKR